MNTVAKTTTVESPIGRLTLVSEDGFLTRLDMEGRTHPATTCEYWERDDSAFGEVIAQLDAYFAGDLQRFDVPLRPAGTEFQRRVWAALQQIPYGRTASYGQLADRVGNPKACRAVGLANGRNPIGIIVPCHRVIGADGTLTGYGGGLQRKRWLLDHETSYASALSLA